MTSAKKKKSLLWDTEKAGNELLNIFAFEAEPSPAYEAVRKRDEMCAFLEIPKLELEKRGENTAPIKEEHLIRTANHVARRSGCSDFSINALTRILYQYPKSKMISPIIYGKIKEALLGFSYWIDEPTFGTGYFGSENHQLCYHTGELLAGQLFPKEIFSNNSQNGDWHKEHAARLIRQWLNWKIRFGFGEWNSHIYVPVSMHPLLNLLDFAEDPQIRQKSRLLIDLALFETAMYQFKGTSGAAHAITYTNCLLNPCGDLVSALGYLLWGRGSFRFACGKAGFFLPASHYRVPALIQEIALDDNAQIECRQRSNMSFNEAAQFGISPEKLEHLGFFWGNSCIAHRRVIEHSIKATHANHGSYPYLKKVYEDYLDAEQKKALYNPKGEDPFIEPKANMYTYKTPDYMLSCAQDFRKGKRGYNEHIWQATLEGRAYVFAFQPAQADPLTYSLSYWHGNATLPRAAAFRNVLIAVYRGKPELDGMPLTHAFFPQFAFDEWTQKGNWTLGRKRNGFVALWSLNKTRWAEPDPKVVPIIRLSDPQPAESMPPYELIAEGRENVWICEMGNRESHGSYERFVQGVGSAEPRGNAEQILYPSPSIGDVRFGWEGPFTVKGQSIALDGYSRYDNPYCHAEFGSSRYEIKHKEKKLILDSDAS